MGGNVKGVGVGTVKGAGFRMEAVGTAGGFLATVISMTE